MSIEKTSKDYWDKVWETETSLDAVNVKDEKLSNFVNLEYDRLFRSIFGKYLDKGNDVKLLEIGCGDSRWLPYFAKELDFSVTGLDYSERGCLRAKKILEHAGVTGEVVQSDLFDPPDNLFEKFDVVVSFGVVEHFNDISKCLDAMGKFLKDGGLLITLIPNHSGLNAFILSWVNKPVLDLHSLVDKKQFLLQNNIDGFEVCECDYLVSLNTMVMNLNGLSREKLSWWAKKILLAALARLTYIVWFFERNFFNLPKSRLFSPYMYSVLKKDGADEQ